MTVIVMQKIMLTQKGLFMMRRKKIVTVKKNLKNQNFLRMYLALLCCSRKEIRKEKLLRKMRTMKTYMSKMLLSLTRKL